MLKNAFKADTGVVITCRTSAMFKLIVIILAVLFTSCARPTHLGQQYLDGRFGKHVLHKVKKPKTDKPKDYAGFEEQLAQVQQSELGNAYEGLYAKVSAWHAAGGEPGNLPHYGAVAADREYLPMGSVLLAEVPQIDETGNWTGEHILNLLTVLDTGGAIKGNHIDLYCGIGERAGAHAGYLKHYGRVWCLHADAGS